MVEEAQLRFEQMSVAGGGRTERRLAAIMAADVVGYSRLMGKNEEGTLFDLKAVRSEVTDPKIDEHRGRIVKTLGDGLLVEFASVVDAVRCAVDIQREMKRRFGLQPSGDPIVLRIGINLGDIIIDEADIFGDGVNVAARLEGLADPGGICVSRIVRDQVRDKLGFGFEDLGQQQVKNIARPVHVFRIPLDGPPSAASRDSKRRSAPSRRSWHLLAAGGGTAVIVAVALLFLKTSTGPGAAPASPIIGDAILFEAGKVGLSRWARAALEQQADFLHDNPGVTVTVETFCSGDEGARADPQVLAQLRANQIRDALEAHGIKGGRIKLANSCQPGNTASSGADAAAQAQNRRAVLIRN
jgi:class 3 adenylate cyclase